MIFRAFYVLTEDCIAAGSSHWGSSRVILGWLFEHSHLCFVFFPLSSDLLLVLLLLLSDFLLLPLYSHLELLMLELCERREERFGW